MIIIDINIIVSLCKQNRIKDKDERDMIPYEYIYIRHATMAHIHTQAYIYIY